MESKSASRGQSCGAPSARLGLRSAQGPSEARLFTSPVKWRLPFPVSASSSAWLFPRGGEGGSQQFQLCGPGSGERLCSLWPAWPVFRAHPLSSHRHPANDTHRVIVVWSGISVPWEGGACGCGVCRGKGTLLQEWVGPPRRPDVAAGDRRALPCPVPCTLSPVWWASIGTDCCAFKNARGKSVAPLRSPLGLPTPWLQEPAP